MSFITSPWAWGPLFALLPVIVIMYLLKLKRKKVQMPSTLLWRRAIQDMVANSPFQKLRNNILMWLQLLILAALIFAFARPMINARVEQGTRHILLIDHSASMETREAGGKSRLELAKKAARDIVDTMNASDEGIVIAFSDHTSIVQTLTSDKARLRIAIDAIEADDVATSLKDAALILEGLTTAVGNEGVRNPRPDTRTVLVSDGRAPDIGALANVPDLEYVKVGEAVENVGISALDVRESFTGTFQHQIFAGITNSGESEQKVLVELQVGSEVVDVKNVDVAGGKTQGVIFTAGEGIQGLATLKIDKEDALAVDNVARGLIAPPTDISVLVVSKGNFFLEQALNTDPRVKVSRVPPTEYKPSDEYQITVFDNCTVGDIPNGNFVFINSLPPNSGYTAEGEELTNPKIVDWNRVHPLSRFVNFEKVLVGKALKLKAPRTAVPILETSGSDLISYLETDQRRITVIGFDIFKSYWPVDVSFPIFLSNLIDLYSRAGGGAARPVYATGSTIPIFPDKESKSAEVTMPGDKKTTLSFAGSLTAYLTSTNRAGIYQVAMSSGKKQMLPVNLLSESESSIAPLDTIEVAGRKIVGTGERAKTNQEIWHWFILGALGVLMLEWYIYCRRTWA